MILTGERRLCGWLCGRPLCSFAPRRCQLGQPGRTARRQPTVPLIVRSRSTATRKGSRFGSPSSFSTVPSFRLCPELPLPAAKAESGSQRWTRRTACDCRGPTRRYRAALRVTVTVCSPLLTAAAVLAQPAADAAAHAVTGNLRESVVLGWTPLDLLLPSARWCQRIWPRSRRRSRRAPSTDAPDAVRIRAEAVAAALSGVVGRLVVGNAQSAGGLLDLSDAEADAVLAWTSGIFCAAGAWTDRSYLRTGALNALAVRHVGTEQTCWRGQ
jgi:hypothetical protein